MLLTQLRYFEALARERHFGRAAASCFVTTSTLSEAIRKLEAELKVPLVNRGRSTYRGLTPEGELVLSYARRIVTDHRALLEDLSARRGQLETTVRLGVIPAGLSRGTAVLEALCRENPGVSVDLVAGLRSEEILAKLQSAELDAGIIHPALGSAQSVTGLHVTDLGSVDFVLLAAEDLVPEDKTVMTGADLVDTPVAVLSPGMRAREEFDRAMADAGVPVAPAAEADSVEALRALAATGRWAAVVPADGTGGTGEAGGIGGAAGVGQRLRVRGLADPTVRVPVVLARLDTRPVSALATALDKAVDNVLDKAL